jgi:hypothetical protein
LWFGLLGYRNERLPERQFAPQKYCRRAASQLGEISYNEIRLMWCLAIKGKSNMATLRNFNVADSAP